MRSKLTTVFILLVSLCAVSASAHTISGPDTVVADSDGLFVYEVTITITEPVEFYNFYADGQDNTDLDLRVEEACIEVWYPGEHITSLGGHLLDPSQNGTVEYSHTMCDSWTGTLTTNIVAPTVATEAVSWSTVKGMYR